MKKILSILSLGCIATGVYAQGLVSLYNLSGTLTTNAVASTYAGNGFTANAGGSGKLSTTSTYYFALLIDASNPGSSPAAAGWTQALFTPSGGTSGAFVGTNYNLVAGGMIGPKGNQATAIDNWGAGNTMFYEIVGWSANLGSTWSQVSGELADGWANIPGYNGANNYFFGVSSVASGASGTPPSGTPLSLFGGTGGFALSEVGVAVPEPTSMALAALGGASLLLFRRKK